VTFFPIETLDDDAVVITARSWTLVFEPMLTVFKSPRTTAPYQTELLSARDTLPITAAEGATKLFAATEGVYPKGGVKNVAERVRKNCK
jgi:hypothetical protein